MNITIELFDAKRCAPVKSGTYFAITNNGCTNMFYSRKHGGWNLNDWDEDRETEMHPLYWSDRTVTGEEIADMSA